MYYMHDIIDWIIILLLYVGYRIEPNYAYILRYVRG